MTYKFFTRTGCYGENDDQERFKEPLTVKVALDKTINPLKKQTASSKNKTYKPNKIVNNSFKAGSEAPRISAKYPTGLKLTSFVEAMFDHCLIDTKCQKHQFFTFAITVIT